MPRYSFSVSPLFGCHFIWRFSRRPTTAPTKASPTLVCRLEKTQLVALGRYTWRICCRTTGRRPPLSLWPIQRQSPRLHSVNLSTRRSHAQGCRSRNACTSSPSPACVCRGSSICRLTRSRRPCRNETVAFHTKRHSAYPGRSCGAGVRPARDGQNLVLRIAAVALQPSKHPPFQLRFSKPNARLGRTAITGQPAARTQLLSSIVCGYKPA